MTRKDDSKVIRIVHPICCGLDVHKESVSACVIFPDDTGVHGRDKVSQKWSLRIEPLQR